MVKQDKGHESIFPERVVSFAKIWERAGAFIIDLLIILLLSVIAGTRIPFPYCLFLASWIYEATQICGYYQATIGQRTMGIKVSNNQGGQLSFIEASLRHFSKYISLLTALSGYLLIVLDKKNRCLHDKIAGSVVVTEESYQAAI